MLPSIVSHNRSPRIAVDLRKLGPTKCLALDTVILLVHLLVECEIQLLVHCYAGIGSMKSITSIFHDVDEEFGGVRKCGMGRRSTVDSPHHDSARIWTNCGEIPVVAISSLVRLSLTVTWHLSETPPVPVMTSCPLTISNV